MVAAQITSKYRWPHRAYSDSLIHFEPGSPVWAVSLKEYVTTKDELGTGMAGKGTAGIQSRPLSTFPQVISRSNLHGPRIALQNA